MEVLLVGSRINLKGRVQTTFERTIIEFSISRNCLESAFISYLYLQRACQSLRAQIADLLRFRSSKEAYLGSNAENCFRVEHRLGRADEQPD